MFTVTVVETRAIGADGAGASVASEATVELYRQSFEVLDIPKLIGVLNKRRRVRKAKVVE